MLKICSFIFDCMKSDARNAFVKYYYFNHQQCMLQFAVNSEWWAISNQYSNVDCWDSLRRKGDHSPAQSLTPYSSYNPYFYDDISGSAASIGILILDCPSWFRQCYRSAMPNQWSIILIPNLHGNVQWRTSPPSSVHRSSQRVTKILKGTCKKYSVSP